MKHPNIVGEKPQNELLLTHFTAKRHITGVEAEALYGVRHLPRRILDLKERGYQFRTERCVAPNRQRYVRYHYEGIQGVPL